MSAFFTGSYTWDRMNAKNQTPDLRPEEFKGTPQVSREQVHARARELALQAGRQLFEVTLADYQRARREILGTYDAKAQEAALEPIEELQVDTASMDASVSQKEDSPFDEEDEEGRGDSAALTDSGVLRAEREQAVGALSHQKTLTRSDD